MRPECVVMWIVSEMEGVLLRFLFHSKYDCAVLDLTVCESCASEMQKLHKNASDCNCYGGQVRCSFLSVLLQGRIEEKRYATHAC